MESKNQDWIEKIEKKYAKMGLDSEAFFKGLYYSKPINYWDYIEVESLLSLQKPRTNYPDEMVFIMYHQVTELLLNMMLHEMYQVCNSVNIKAEFFIEKIGRMNRYIQMLANSFDVMRLGMNPEQYNEFRYTLTPASGFQCASFRYAEICCTDIENLVDSRLKNNLPEQYDMAFLFENIYWQAAGKDFKTGKKSYLLNLFEEKYLEKFIKMANELKTKNIWQQYLSMSESEKNNKELVQALKDLDIEFNIKWPIVHLRAAEHYLDHGNKVVEATGGSEWKKYLHPKYQRRVFFPGLWTKEELENWAKDFE